MAAPRGSLWASATLLVAAARACLAASSVPDNVEPAVSLSALWRRLQAPEPTADGTQSWGEWVSAHGTLWLVLAVVPFCGRLILDFVLSGAHARCYRRCRRRREHATITPLHRAARAKDADAARSTLEEVQTQPDKDRTFGLDTQMMYGVTPFMLACERGKIDIAVMLLEAGCDGALTDDRGRTGVQIALSAGQEALVQSLSQSHAALTEGPPHRSGYQDSFRIMFDRFMIWCEENPFPPSGKDDKQGAFNWKYLTEGGFGKVYLVSGVWPPIELGGERLDTVAIKVAKPGSDADELDFRKEIADLAQLNHPNIVRIIGFTSGKMSAEATKPSWMLVMDFCETDLDKLSADEALRSDSDGSRLLLDLLTQTAAGMLYIHSQKKTHWDLKPENVLVANGGTAEMPRWVARVAGKLLVCLSALLQLHRACLPS